VADNVAVTAGSGTTIAADEVVDGTLGTVKVQYVKLMDGALDGTTKAGVGSGGLKVDPSGVTSPVSLASVPSHAVTNAGTFAVQNTAATPAGTNIVGKVGIDQTTDGTTNLVRLGAETTKVLGVTRTADGSGNLLTSTANALDVNIKSGVNANGRATPANSAPVVSASQTYETVAASQTAQVLGGTGATGDWLDFVLVIPATTSPGSVTLLDNATSITLFAGGASSVASLVPFAIPIRAISAGGAWKITTGANVSVIGVGNFTT